VQVVDVPGVLNRWMFAVSVVVRWVRRVGRHRKTRFPRGLSRETRNLTLPCERSRARLYCPLFRDSWESMKHHIPLVSSDHGLARAYECLCKIYHGSGCNDGCNSPTRVSPAGMCLGCDPRPASAGFPERLTLPSWGRHPGGR
jgi:hypothetical protein